MEPVTSLRRAATLLAGALAATALLAPAGAQAGTHAAQKLSDELWLGPISTERLADSVDRFDGRNFNFPEESATYWLARVDIPEGAELTLRGRYPHARYMSLNSYLGGGVPADALADVKIAPDPGSANPFHAGARRDGRKRSWTLRVVKGARPADPAARRPNTLYTGVTGDRPTEIVLRVYEPDRGLDLTGGEGLPQPELVLPDGRRLVGAAAVGAAINDEDRTLDSTVLRTPVETFRQLINMPGADPATAPAVNPAQWERSFNQRANLNVYFQAAGRGRPFPDNPDEGSFYSNDDTRYVFSYLSRRYGEVAVIRARMPQFPATRDRARVMPSGQVRFWSLCSAESRVTTRTPDCVADRQVPLDEQREYTIVVSTRADRPRNARAACGVAWLDFGDRGDAAGRPDAGLLIMRNMLADAGFANSIQRITKFGDEQAVMGPYAPRTEYSSIEDFEAGGCSRHGGGDDD